jgi:hypothetical protein
MGPEIKGAGFRTLVLVFMPICLVLVGLAVFLVVGRFVGW